LQQQLEAANARAREAERQIAMERQQHQQQLQAATAQHQLQPPATISSSSISPDPAGRQAACLSVPAFCQAMPTECFRSCVAHTVLCYNASPLVAAEK
jgi:hypothetical protein